MRILLLVFSLLALPAKAGVLYSGSIVPGTTTLHTTYSVADATNFSVPNALKFGGQLCIANNNASDIAVYVDNDLATVAPTGGVQDIYVPGGFGYCLPLTSRVTRSIQFRSASGSNITSGGTVYWVLSDHKG